MLTKLNTFVFEREWLIGPVRFFANWFIWLVLIGVLLAVFVDPLAQEFVIEESPEIILGILLARGVLVPLLHRLIRRQRPYVVLELMRMFVPHGKYAFPSGHATFFSAFGFALLPIAPALAIVLLLAALLNGTARVAGALHWPSDVLGGFAAGYIGIWLAVEIFSQIPDADMMTYLR